MELVNAVARHERRVRLLFDTPLAPAASGQPSLFHLTSKGGDVNVVGLVLIAGQPHAIDLVLGADLLEGAPYEAHAAGVAATDGTISAAGTNLPIRLGATPAKPNVEVSPDDIAELLYGVDLVWDGRDYAEDAAGDLACVTGPANARAALERRLMADGLPWDDTYGAHPRAYVDGTPGAIGTLHGALVRQAHADDRVRSATATLVVEDDTASFEIVAHLIGEETVTVSVSPSRS